MWQSDRAKANEFVLLLFVIVTRDRRLACFAAKDWQVVVELSCYHRLGPVTAEMGLSVKET